MIPSFPILAAVLFAVFLTGCDAPHAPAVAVPPALVIDQWPDYPVPGRGSDFPGGTVVALWRDGRMIRSATPETVGKSYVEGMVAPEQCAEFFRYLGTAAARAPKIEYVPLHTATHEISIRGDTTSEWTCILPDTTSIWREVEARLFGLPLQQCHDIDAKKVEELMRKK